MAKNKSKKKDQDVEADEPVKSKKGKASAELEGAGDPVSGDNFNPDELNGKLLIIWPTGLEEGIETKFGTKDATRADVAVLNEKKVEKSEELNDVLIFAGVLQGQLRGARTKGNAVLGRLYQDDSTKKTKGNAAWRLSTPTGAELEVGKAYLAQTSPITSAKG